MKIRLWGVCASLALLPPSQEAEPEKMQRLGLGSAPTWVAAEQPALLESIGPVSVIGPISSSLFAAPNGEARHVYLAVAGETPGPAPTKLALRAPWRLLLLPPKAGDLQIRELRFRGVELSLQQEALKLESNCGSCGHHGPAILTQTALGTLYLPVDLQPKENATPPPSRVRFQ